MLSLLGIKRIRNSKLDIIIGLHAGVEKINTIKSIYYPN